MNELISIVVTTFAYCVLGTSVYKLCKACNIGNLYSVPVWVIFIWPLILVIIVFVSDED